MQVIKDKGSVPIKAWVGTREEVIKDSEDDVPFEKVITVPDMEDSALQQAKNIARLPFIFPKGVALMPNVHWGMGATIGSVIPSANVVIPAAVGVDIGCGMNAVRLSIKGSQLPDNLKEIRHQIERDVPVGTGRNGDHNIDCIRTSVTNIPMSVLYAMGSKSEAKAQDQAQLKASTQLGTLGSENHFIELCTDENDDVWVMLHSGSRGIGNLVGRYYVEKAKDLMAKFFISLPDKDLAYLPDGTQEFADYVEAVEWAQNYALENRKEMMFLTVAAIKHRLPELTVEVTSEAVSCHHNYIAREHHFGQNLWITRKGAVRAREGELGIIPGSMGQKSYIVRGKGNPDSYCSCSHGAGRAMSRGQARGMFTALDLERQTEGVECRKDLEVVDEIPSAYKDLDIVMANQTELVEVVHTLKAVLCVKGS